jgi:aspartyl-tRNA(Asn)/glutamyl-tRNA(Gln) amidotransferase subunit B
MKNMNSFSGVERALEFEFARQCAALDRGEKISQQTLLWDAGTGEARVSRTKEGSHDYRYFPEPDLLPLILHPEWVSTIKSSVPELPADRKKRFADEYKLGHEDVEKLTALPLLSDYFESAARISGEPKAAANWVMGEVQAAVNNAGIPISEFPVRPADLGQLIKLVNDGLVSRTAAKVIFTRMVETGKPAAQVAHDMSLLQVGDDSAITGWIDEVIAEHPDEAKRYLAGEKKLQGVLVGLVMKKSGGKADPKRLNQLLSSRAGAG